jgi:ferrous iron transport protein B
MQCLSTLAVVKRETKSWKWPMLQLFAFGAMAYLGGWICFHVF